jgi:hypothetical protein
MLPMARVPTEFKTHFLMPSKFRFEWREWHPHFGKTHTPNEHIVWSDGEDTHQIILGELTHPDLQTAIGSATAISELSILMILPLLLHNPFEPQLPFMWSEMRDSRIIKEEVVNGYPCYHLIGTTNTTYDKEVWISKEDYIVRRLKTKIEITNTQAEEQFSAMMAALKDSGQDLRELPTNYQDLLRYLPNLPSTEYVHNYRSVMVDKPLPVDLFEFDPNNPPKVSRWGPIK